MQNFLFTPEVLPRNQTFVFHCSLLGRLFALLALLLAGLSRGSLLDAVQLLDHEGPSDPVPDLLVSKDATIGSADGSGSAASSLEVSGTHDFDAGHLGSVRLLFDVLNSELATRRFDLAEAVRLRAV